MDFRVRKASESAVSGRHRAVKAEVDPARSLLRGKAGALANTQLHGIGGFPMRTPVTSSNRASAQRVTMRSAVAARTWLRRRCSECLQNSRHCPPEPVQGTSENAATRRPRLVAPARNNANLASSESAASGRKCDRGRGSSNQDDVS